MDLTETHKTTNSLSRRLSHLESEVAGISTKVDGLESGLGRVITAVDGLAQKIGEGRQTNWGVVISSLGLVVILGSLCLAPIYNRLEDDKTSQRRQWTAIRAMPSVLVAGIKEIEDEFEEDLDKLDEVVQREMRLLDQVIKDSIEDMDRRLQEKMELKDQIVEERSKARHEKVLLQRKNGN